MFCWVTVGEATRLLEHKQSTESSVGHGAEVALERGFISPAVQSMVILGSSLTCGVGLL